MVVFVAPMAAEAAEVAMAVLVAALAAEAAQVAVKFMWVVKAGGGLLWVLQERYLWVLSWCVCVAGDDVRPAMNSGTVRWC